MMSFRGFQWIYDVTNADEEARVRAASFVRLLHDAERVNGHRRVTRRPSPAPREPDVLTRAPARSASTRRRRTASDPFLLPRSVTPPRRPTRSCPTCTAPSGRRKET
jgi:hypothetical protein